MKRNGWEIAYIVWIVLVVGLMLFWPARAAEDAERTENHTEITPECTERAIEAKPDEEPENEYIEAALYACLQCPGVYGGVLWRLNARGVSIATSAATPGTVITSCVVWKWRKKNKLPPNKRKKPY